MANINIRIDESLKKEAESVFEKIGLTASAAINLFYRQVVRTNSIPFKLTADEPNKATIISFDEGNRIVANNKTGYKDIDSLKNALK